MASASQVVNDSFAINPYLIPTNFNTESYPFWQQMWAQNPLTDYVDPSMATGLASLLAEGGIVRKPGATTTTSPTTTTTNNPTTTTAAPEPYYPDRLLQPGEIDPRVFNTTPTANGGQTTISGGNTAGPRDANGDYLDPRDDPYSSVNNPGRAPNPKGMGKTIADLMKSF